MLSFSTNIKIVKDLNKDKWFNDCKYKVYQVEADGLLLNACITKRAVVRQGSFYHVEQAYLTCYEELTSSQKIVLRIDYVDEEVSEEIYLQAKHLTVKVNGKFVIGKQTAVRPIGPMARPFLPCTVFICNERKEWFCVFVGVFGDLAYRFANMKQDCWVDITGRLRKRKNRSGYELHIISYAPVSENKNIMEVSTL